MNSIIRAEKPSMASKVFSDANILPDLILHKNHKSALQVMKRTLEGAFQLLRTHAVLHDSSYYTKAVIYSNAIQANYINPAT